MTRASVETRIRDLKVGDVVMSDPADDGTARVVLTVVRGAPVGEPGFGARQVRILLSDMTRLQADAGGEEAVLLVGRIDLDGVAGFSDPLSGMSAVAEPSPAFDP